MKPRFFLLILCVGLSFCLCACSSSPKSAVVTSKNDGSFDASIVVTDEEPEKNREEIKYNYSEQFYSLDGSVSFQFKLESALQNSKMPVIEVCPHNFTPEDAQYISNLLFGDTQLFESDPSDMLTKEEIRNCITLWTKYLSTDALVELYGVDNDLFISQMKSEIQRYLVLSSP